jgi:hypothetical protein
MSKLKCYAIPHDYLNNDYFEECVTLKINLKHNEIKNYIFYADPPSIF